MGQAASTSSGAPLSYSSNSHVKPLRSSSSCAAAAVAAPRQPGAAATGEVYAPERDYTVYLPDECLALVFHSLGSGDRKRCSLVCRRWLVVEGQSRHRLALDSRAALLVAAPAVFTRFNAVSKLALKCDRRSDSIGDAALLLIAARCPKLTRLKLRACRAVTEVGMSAVAEHCHDLRKLSVGSCTFGPKCHGGTLPDA